MEYLMYFGIGFAIGWFVTAPLRQHGRSTA